MIKVFEHFPINKMIKRKKMGSSFKHIWKGHFLFIVCRCARVSLHLANAVNLSMSKSVKVWECKKNVSITSKNTEILRLIRSPITAETKADFVIKDVSHSLLHSFSVLPLDRYIQVFWQILCLTGDLESAVATLELMSDIVVPVRLKTVS